MASDILIVDDEEDIRRLVSFNLGEASFRVEAVENGKNALEAAARIRPHVIVLDLQMPGPPPGELLRDMARTAPGVPIVTFSGFEPDLVAPEEAALVALHIPKTTDLALVRQSVVEVARGRS